MLPALSPSLNSLPASFLNIQSQYSEIYAIISPPRCSSTAFARVFWQHPDIGYYSHEPFEVTYYMDQGLTEVAAKLSNPLNLNQFNSKQNTVQGNSLVIKEMPYQVWHNFPLLVTLVKKPIIFLIRDPRLNITSRITKKREAGTSTTFPHIETGWQLLHQQVSYCQNHAISYTIVDTTDFRNAPNAIVPQVFSLLGLKFSPTMLFWESHAEIELDNLDGAHSHLYERVLSSKGIQPATEPIPSLDTFPIQNQFRAHVTHCLELYQELRHNPHRIQLKPLVRLS